MYCGMCGKAIEEAADFTSAGVPRCAECVAAATVAPPPAPGPVAVDPGPPAPKPLFPEIVPASDGSGIAVGALALGAVGLSTSFFLIGGVFGLAGFILGVASLCFRRSARSMAWTGICLSAAALLIAGFLGYTFAQAVPEERWAEWEAALTGDESPAVAMGEDWDLSDVDAEAARWVGVRVPDLAVETLDGESFSLSDLRGRRVIVDVWATWCAPCLNEIPHFQQLHEETPEDELRIVGISFEDESTVRDFLAEHEMDYAVAAAKDYETPAPFRNPPALPTTFFVDRNGVIDAVETGYRDYDQLLALASREDYAEAVREFPAPRAEEAEPDASVQAKTEEPAEEASDPASDAGPLDGAQTAEAQPAKESSHTELIRAALRADRRALRRLLAQGQQINERDDDGMTALMHASSRGLLGNVSMLLDLGARVDSRDGRRHTALIHAARNGRVAVVELLVQRGADRLAVDQYGKTALDWARERRHVDVVAALSAPGRS